MSGTDSEQPLVDVGQDLGYFDEAACEAPASSPAANLLTTHSRQMERKRHGADRHAACFSPG